MLVVDDASPDGTGEVLESLRASHPRLRVIHRPRKLGLGTAHKLAIHHAVAGGYDALITMDADFSHHPKYLPVMADALRDHDFVTASRYVRGGSCQYGLLRQLLSRGANRLARITLGFALHETTTSYRGFRRDLLRRLDLDDIRSEGYSYFVESLYRVTRLTSCTSEFPIHFEDRRHGTTKISRREIWKGLSTVFRLGLQRLRNRPLTARAADRSGALPCPVCGCPYHVEEYPARHGAGAAEGQYRCTSTGHASHGRIVKCLGCGLVHTNPQPSADELLAAYTDVEDHEYLANRQARLSTFRYNLERIAPLLPAAGRLLDVGSYCGLFLSVARERGYEVAGVEPSRWASRYAEETLGIKTHRGTLADLPEDPVRFDVVCAWDVLEHVSDPLADLRRMHALLRPGGMLAFATLNYANWVPRLLGERWPWMMDMHLYYFQPPDLATMLARAGFALRRQQSYCHIVTLDYLLLKLHALSLPGAELLRKLVARTPLRRVEIPFRFGDIQLFVAERSAEAAAFPAASEARSERPRPQLSPRQRPSEPALPS